MVYGYIRISSINQNIDRQYETLLEYGIESLRIYIDNQSGKDFRRERYQKLIQKLKINDLLVVKSIDRLGRNYEMIIEEWTRITKAIGADIVVLDTRQKAENLVGRFISDIALQVLSFVAQNERELVKQRRMEGITKAKRVHLDRPNLPVPDNFKQMANDYINSKITNIQARTSLNNISKGPFFRNLKKYKVKMS